MLPCHTVAKGLCRLAEADASVSGPDTVLERERKWRGIRAISFLLRDPQETEEKSGQTGLTPLSWEILSGD